jgi:hypothetical protein
MVVKLWIKAVRGTAHSSAKPDVVNKEMEILYIHK